jgi:hypothetical protein
MSKQVDLNTRALRKSFAHILKNQQHDCIGVLLGSRSGDSILVTDAVPLFHDRVFAGALESAFMMIGQVYSDLQIVGMYDAPLKYKKGDAVPLSSIALNLCEQIRATLQVSDVVAVSLRVPAKVEGDDSDDEPKIKEVTEDDSDEGLLVDSFIVSASSNPKKAKMASFEK